MVKSWISEVMLGEENNINAIDLDLIPITDSVDEVVKIIGDFYSGDHAHRLEPNYDI